MIDSSVTLMISRRGRPLHFAFFAYDRSECAEFPGSGRQSPLCGAGHGRRGGVSLAGWHFTGPWSTEWERDKRGGLCSKCVKMLDRMTAAVAVLERVEQ